MSTDADRRLTSLTLTGSHYDVGQQLGRMGAATVHGHLVRTHAWATVTALGRDERVQAMKALVEERHPHYLQELSGLADGLELPFDDVFAWNCRGDIRALAPDGCTTVQLPGPAPVIAHNEDGDPGLRAGCALARVAPDGAQAFTAFVYPGSLPGHTFAINDAGLVLTVNNIRSRNGGAGVPRMVLGRAVIGSDGVDAALRLLRETPRAGAFHFTLAQAGRTQLVGVEFTHARCSIEVISQPSAHANHLVHPAMLAEPQIITASSGARQDRARELLGAQAGAPDPLSILRDTRDPALPIYRTQPDDPDNENTLATAVFKISRDGVNWSVYDDAQSAARFGNVRSRFAAQ